MTTSDSSPSETRESTKELHESKERKPDLSAMPKIWVTHMPFKKDGFPTIAGFGALSRGVVIMEIETWTRLVAEHPTLATTQFNVGSYE